MHPYVDKRFHPRFCPVILSISLERIVNMAKSIRSFSGIQAIYSTGDDYMDTFHVLGIVILPGRDTPHMMELEKLCNVIEKMGQEEFDNQIAEHYGRALRGLRRIYDDEKKCRGLLTVAAMAAAHVDGKFTEGEFRQIGGLIDVASGTDVTYAQAKALIENTITEKNSEEDFVQSLYLALARVDTDAATAYIMFLIFICCADGDASWKERKWLKNIYQ